MDVVLLAWVWGGGFATGVVAAAAVHGLVSWRSEQREQRTFWTARGVTV